MGSTPRWGSSAGRVASPRKKKGAVDAGVSRDRTRVAVGGPLD